MKESFIGLSLSSKSIKEVAKQFLESSKDIPNIEQLWSESFKQAKHASDQLALFYVLHETVIHCKHEPETSLKDSLKSCISESIPFLKSSHVIIKIKKLINCWNEKQLFDHDFTLKLLREIHKKSVDNRKDAVSLVEDFSPESLALKLKDFSAMEGDILNFVELEPPKVDLNITPEEVLSNLKTRKETQTLSEEIEAYRTELNTLVSIYDERLQHLSALQDALEMGELFFEIQQKDASVVVAAYSTYQSKVRNNLEQIEKYELSIPSPTQDEIPLDCPLQADSQDILPYVDEFGDVDYRLKLFSSHSNAQNEDDSMDISDDEESFHKSKVPKREQTVPYKMPSPPAPPAELLDTSYGAPEIPSQLLDFIKTLPSSQTNIGADSVTKNGSDTISHLVPFPNRYETVDNVPDSEQNSGSGTPTQDEVVDRMRENPNFVTSPLSLPAPRTAPMLNLVKLLLSNDFIW
ncbi:Regulation of nuclear pre-mRNA domain-containing protein 2 [Cichlidogyrus casuarinus]|uniref:Regulation of nuclear pre-mRNA domain-containing protein 2 n=1 Tax=Cichlidogyrus casuarinus TaxID=1844966 RepID=A0ABD2QR48_9PLAT